MPGYYIGYAASNKKLSTDRAKSVMDALAAKGIDKSRILSVGWGQEKPVADKETVSPMGTSTCGLLHLRNQNQKGISVKPMQSK